MPTIWTYVRVAAVLVGSSAALLTGGIAHADPAPPPAPAPAPAPDISQQLISSAANAPQILQNFVSALSGNTQAPTGALGPSQPVPGTIPGVSGVPGLSTVTPGLNPTAPVAQATTPSIPGVNAPIPGLTAPTPATATSLPGGAASIPGVGPAAPAAVQAAAPGLVPSAKVDLPAMPYLPVHMPQQLSLPGDLPALASSAFPGAPVTPQPGSPAAQAPAAPSAPTTLLGALP